MSAAFRYTVRLLLQPGDRTVDYTVVTRMGEHKAAVMAAQRQTLDDPESHVYGVEIVRLERDVEIDPARDLLDYWEVS